MKGWRYESARHALSAKGIKTTRRYNVKSFLEKYYEERDAKRAALAGMGTKQQELAAERARQQRIAGMSEREKAEAQLVIVEATRGRKERNTMAIDAAHPEISDAEVIFLRTYVRGLPAGDDEARSAAKADARRRLELLENYKYAMENEVFSRRKAALMSIIEGKLPKQPEGSEDVPGMIKVSVRSKTSSRGAK